MDDSEYISCALDMMQTGYLTSESYKYLQYLLMKHEIRYRKYVNVYPLCKTQITGNEIMFISDTHFGDYTTNGNLVQEAYNTALQKNIKTVIHAGDLIEGTCQYHNKSYENVLNEFALAFYSMPDEITTKLLLGNHDYSAIRSYPDIIRYYVGYDKLEILGMQKVLLNWDGIADIFLHHPIMQLKYPPIMENPGILTIEGHHHSYQFNEERRNIYLPTLSSSYQCCDNNSLPVWPLFVIASKVDENNLLFTVYGVDKVLKTGIKPSQKIEVNTQTRKLTLYNS